MPTHSRLTDDAQSCAEDAHVIAQRLRSAMLAHYQDRQISIDDARQLIEQADRLVTMTGETVQSTEAASVAQLMAAAILTGDLNTHIWRRARRVPRLAPMLGRLSSYVQPRMRPAA